MDRLLKHALDNDAVGFINRFKEKMAAHNDESRNDITRQVAADMAGVEVQEAKKEDMHVVVYKQGKGIKWSTSDSRTGGEPQWSDPKDEKKLRAYFTKVLGSKTFTLEVLEAEKSDLECMECGKKFKKTIGKGEVKCPKCGSTDVDVA